MPKNSIERLKLEGYKSIVGLDLEVGFLNVLIGANSTGKSNILSIFSLLNSLTRGGLADYVTQQGGASSLLHHGPKSTPRMSFELISAGQTGKQSYRAAFLHKAPEDLEFSEEKVSFWSEDKRVPSEHYITNARRESGLPELLTRLQVEGSQKHAAPFIAYLCSFRHYHFHDTSRAAQVRLSSDVHADRYLYPDAGNLAAFLFMLKQAHPRHYREILETVKLAFPLFAELVLEPSRTAPDKIVLRWRERGSDYEFGPHQMSDGTLRFLCLATLLLQPFEHANAPRLIVLDEPELGLHPYAIQLLVSMLQTAAKEVQIIASTQSSSLVSALADPAAVVIVERGSGGDTTARRLDPEEVAPWLEEYTLGDVWEKGVFGGRPRP
jgi:predicted ATPase